eukprot:7387321-Prymnesium_polylepis.2
MLSRAARRDAGGLVVLLLDDLARKGGSNADGGGSGDVGGDGDSTCGDGGSGDLRPPDRPILGDVLVLLGATIYAASNVAQERLVGGTGDRVEYLARLGGYGTVRQPPRGAARGAQRASAASLPCRPRAPVACWPRAVSAGRAPTSRACVRARPQLVASFQCALLERDDIRRAFTCMAHAAGGGGGAEVAGLGVGFVASLTTFYLLVATLLQNGSTATVMNLSLVRRGPPPPETKCRPGTMSLFVRLPLPAPDGRRPSLPHPPHGWLPRPQLTSDFWSVLVGVTLLGERVGPWYAFSFASVVLGLLLYHWADGPACPDRLTEPLVDGTQAADAAAAARERRTGSVVGAHGACGARVGSLGHARRRVADGAEAATE